MVITANDVVTQEKGVVSIDPAHVSCMDVRVELQRKLSAKELMLLKCGVGEDS